jgi:hypothetical protein
MSGEAVNTQPPPPFPPLITIPVIQVQRVVRNAYTHIDSLYLLIFNVCLNII